MKKHIKYLVSLGGFTSKVVYSKTFDTLTKARSFARSLSRDEAIHSWPVLVESYQLGEADAFSKSWLYSRPNLFQLTEKWINGHQVWAHSGPSG